MASNSPLSRTPASYSQREADFIGGQHMSSESRSLETSVVIWRELSGEQS